VVQTTDAASQRKYVSLWEKFTNLYIREVCMGERGNEEGEKWERRIRGDQRGGNLYVKKCLKLLKKKKCTKEIVRDRKKYKPRYFRNVRLPNRQLTLDPRHFLLGS
jgi:hypothetical protein